MSFAVHQELAIGGIVYRVAPHPQLPGYPFGQEGRQAVVYRLIGPDGPAGESSHALKVFKAWYRRPALVGLADSLEAFADLPGLAVCRRSVLTPQTDANLLRANPSLVYAVRMPWVEGPTWMEVLTEKRPLPVETCLSLARSLLELLAAMEQRRLAHCDLSSQNLLLPALSPVPGSGPAPVALVDVEQLHAPGLAVPESLPGGSPGYAHHTAGAGLWTASADRYAGAVLLTEILCWCDPEVRQAGWGESYFHADELFPGAAPDRYRVLVGALRRRWSPDLAALFERAWRSEVLADCPTFGDWLVRLPEAVPQPAPPAVQVSGPPAASRAAPVPGTGGEAPPWDETDELFAGGLDAYRRGELSAARELLAEVVRRSPAYRQGIWTAADLLRQLTAPPGKAVSAGAAVISAETAERLFQLRTLQGRLFNVAGVAFADDGEQLAVAFGHTAGLWRTADGSLQHLLPGHSGLVTAVTSPPGDSEVVTVSADTTVRLWDANEGIPLHVLTGHSQAVTDAAFRPDGKLLATTSRDQTIRFWDAGESPRPAGRPPLTGSSDLLTLAFAPDGRLLAAGDREGTVSLWRLADGRLVRTLRGHLGSVRSVAFRPDGDRLASGSSDGTVRLWHPDGRPDRTLIGHAGQVTAVAFSPDGSLLASASGDRTVRLWQAEDGALLTVLKGHSTAVECLAFASDGRLLATGGYDGVRLWGIP